MQDFAAILALPARCCFASQWQAATLWASWHTLTLLMGIVERMELSARIRATVVLYRAASPVSVSPVLTVCRSHGCFST
jgi:hypothetical protein